MRSLMKSLWILYSEDLLSLIVELFILEHDLRKKNVMEEEFNIGQMEVDMKDIEKTTEPTA